MNSKHELASRSYALIAASSAYQDSGLAQLRAPARESGRLAAVLTDPRIGGYQVQSLVDMRSELLAEEIEGFFTDRRAGDTALLYLSCHGVKDLDGRLRFATTNTKLNRLAATTIAADFVYELVDRCRADNVLVLLDCCYSGAYLKNHLPRSADRADIGTVRGRGRAVITSCTSLEYSFEVDSGAVDGTPAVSVFTNAVIEGLATGQADHDHDGLVSVDDLYSYAFEQVRQTTPYQTPEKKWGDIRGDFIIARSVRQYGDTVEQLPADLEAALISPYAKVRAGAVEEVAALADGSLPAVARTARDMLSRLLTDDSKLVSSAAAAALIALGHRAADLRQEQSLMPSVRVGPSYVTIAQPESGAEDSKFKEEQRLVTERPTDVQMTAAIRAVRSPSRSENQQAPQSSRDGKLDRDKGEQGAEDDAGSGRPIRSDYPDWNLPARNRLWCLATYVLPLTLYGFVVLPIVMFVRWHATHDRLFNMNAIQALELSVAAAPAITFIRLAVHASSRPLQVFYAVSAGVTGIVIVGFFAYCIVLLARGEQPRIRIISDIAFRLAYGGSLKKT